MAKKSKQPVFLANGRHLNENSNFLKFLIYIIS